MAANTSMDLIGLDFDDFKASLIKFLQNQPILQDYDFTGSNINVLIDLLSYNSSKLAFFLNMIGSEMFLDSAQMRDSVISRAKELNYLPQSFKSAKATINIQINADPSINALLLPKGASFSTRIGSNTFSFTYPQNQVLTSSNGTFFANNIDIFEGSYFSDTFTVNYSANTRYLLSNPNIDVSSITVNVIEDSGANVLSYSEAESLFNLQANSQVFFVQAAENEQYEVLFGNGIVGRQPKDGSTVAVDYRVSSGELPNGAFVFVSDGLIDGQSNIAIQTVTAASGGSVSEDIESIRFNAPRHFATQERTVVTSDYEDLLKENFPEINAVSAYGGEDSNPPEYGKVFIAIDLTNFDGLPVSKQTQYNQFLQKRKPLGITPVFIEPEYTYISVNSDVKYDISVTTLPPSDIQSLAISSIIDFNNSNLNDFKSNFYYSKFVEAISDSHISIISNETNYEVFKKINPSPGITSTFVLNFNTSLESYIPEFRSVYDISEPKTLRSSRFNYNNQTCILNDDGQGNINIVRQTGTSYSVIVKVGFIDYDSGLITLSNFNIKSYEGDSLRIYVIPEEKDYSVNNNVILAIAQDEILVNVEEIQN